MLKICSRYSEVECFKKQSRNFEKNSRTAETKVNLSGNKIANKITKEL